MKRQTMVWEKIFVDQISDKGLISKIKNEHIQLNSKKKKPKEIIMNEYKDLGEQMNRCSHKLIVYNNNKLETSKYSTRVFLSIMSFERNMMKYYSIFKNYNLENM